MATVIFHFEGGGQESALELEDDGTFTYWTWNNYWAVLKHGSAYKSETLVLEDAKRRWPSYAADMDQAVRQRKSAN